MCNDLEIIRSEMQHIGNIIDAEGVTNSTVGEISTELKGIRKELNDLNATLHSISKTLKQRGNL